MHTLSRWLSLSQELPSLSSSCTELSKGFGMPRWAYAFRGSERYVEDGVMVDV